MTWLQSLRHCVKPLLWKMWKVSDRQRHLLYLRGVVILLHVARIHVLGHDDEDQEVGSGERARSAAADTVKAQVRMFIWVWWRRGGKARECSTWSRRPVVWCAPGWKHAGPPLPPAPRCCWAAELNGAPGIRCTARTAWGGSASPRPVKSETHVE